jgi:NIMA (never in mitosis gene a)-related kinase 1/4/5
MQVRISNLKEKEKENALNEVRLLASISSDFIIKYKEAFFDSPSNTLCIVIEYADGGDLEVPLPPRRR